MSLEELIKERIREHGPITVADYMALCLSHPEYGYYMQRDPLGAQGDFTTAPEISQIFGELMGLWLAAQWQKQGSPEAILVELGPGRGTLSADMLRATKKVSHFHDNIQLHMVEISPVLRQKQWQTLAGKHAELHWHESVDALPPLPIFFIANEFFDALPIHQYVSGVEQQVTVEGEQLAFTIAAGDSVVTERCPAAKQVMKQLAGHIAKHGGAGLVIDYGYVGGSRADTLQAMKRHEYCPVLETPGEADLTAHVDFDVLAQVAETHGVSPFGAVAQGKFLLQIGASQRLMNLCQTANEQQRPELMSGFERLISHEQMGELFKVLAVMPKGSDRPEGF